MYAVIVKRLPLIALYLSLTLTASAQQKSALTFDLASIHQNNSGTGPGSDPDESNIPLGPGNVYTPTGGQLNLRNIDFLQFVSFAYRMNPAQQDALHDMLPSWAKDARFDLRARTDKTDVTKDELRLMMRSLLADRFGLAVHYEDRTISVFSMQFIKPGTLGPQLRVHPGNSCSTDFKGQDDTAAAPDGYPNVCGGTLLMKGSTGERLRIGGRDMALNTIASSMPAWGDLGRPVVNDTGSTGNYDFRIEFLAPRVTATGQSDLQGPTFREALSQQLGLKLESQKKAVPILVLDHLDHLSDN